MIRFRIAGLMIAAVALATGIAVAQGGNAGAVDAARAELGRRLFYDADLSADGSMACATCHEQHRGFADGNRSHPGVHGDPARRNVPGLANVAGLRSFTWGDPRIRTLEAQMLVPVLGTNPIEMGMHGQEAEIVRRIGRDPCYASMFAAAFPASGGRIDMAAIAAAIAGFERTMISRDAPYDRARSGGMPLGALAQAGARSFRHDCAGCHAGPLFTDGRFHRILPPTADRGLGEISGKPADDGRFRTPGLRNVAVTGPYFHDGSAATLVQAIARHPGRRTADETAALAAFLATLTDRGFLTDRRFALPTSACGRPL